MLDAKRRQGFLRTLVDFQSSYNGIQKKHAVMNNNQRQLFNHHRGGGGGGGGGVAGSTRMDTKFPLLLSSGSRQDYTRGTDEGPLALRAPQDVDFFLRHFAGGGGAGEDNKGSDDNHSTDAINGVVVGARSGNGKGARHRVAVASAAERALARARDRATGVVVVAASPHRRGSKRLRPPGGGWETRSYVVGVAGGRLGSDDVAAERGEDDGDQDDDEDEDGDILPHMTGAISLIDWLSSSRDRTANGETEDGIAAESAPSIPSRTPLESKVKDDDTAADKPSSPSTGSGIRTTMGIGDGDDLRIDPNEDSDENDDLQDGYIAM